MNKEISDYREAQLKKIKFFDEFGTSIQITNSMGKTNWIGIDETELAMIITILTS